MNYCFLTHAYPGKHNLSDFAFVKQLVDAIAKQGNDCYVIAPYNINHYKRVVPQTEVYEVGQGNVTVFRPWYLSFSKSKLFDRLSQYTRKKALEKAFCMISVKPDVLYGHFWSSAFEGYHYAKQNNIPLVVASGESEIKFLRNAKTSEFCDYVSGVVCVSSKNRDESIALGLTTCEKCQVFPNAVNVDLFKKMNKQECRKYLGLPRDAFIVAFVGWFNERKGVLRVSDAIKRITGEEVYSLFIGKGEQLPNCSNILFKGSLPHAQIPYYLNAANIFVLPTLHEGCCNAVVEAMACGLPIVSSNLSFNWDVLNESNSIMIDPNNIEEIAMAIQELRDNIEKRNRLSQGALAMVRNLTIEKRATAIIDFICSKI